MHIALGNRADVQRSIVGRQANDLRWSRRCYYLFEAVFVGFPVSLSARSASVRVLIPLDTGHELGDTCTRVGQVGFCAYPIGVAGARCFCQLVLKGNCEPAYDLEWEQWSANTGNRAFP
ncbi:hypothetical protein QP150_00390 [Sphingomonas sp. 22L2VL55-3]